VRLAAHEPFVGLLEVRHRVRVGALDPVLAADHVMEAERRVVVRQPDADHRPARPQQLEPEPARGFGADRVQHQVWLLGVLLRAQRERPRATFVVRLDHGDMRDPVQQRRLERDQPDRAGTDDDRALDARRRQPHGMHAVGQRLHQCADA
jgi:hypothetical protein